MPESLSAVLRGLPDPDRVGQSEYRTLHEFLTELATDPETTLDLALTAVDEFSEWLAVIRRALAASTLHVVTGRLAGDDEDTCLLVRAVDDVTARDGFREMLRDLRPAERDKEVFVNAIIFWDASGMPCLRGKV